MSETTSTTTTNAQWLRAISFVVADMQGNGIELAGKDTNTVFRIRFNVSYQLSSAPCMLNARIYNLSDATIQKILGYVGKGTVTAEGVPSVTTGQVVLKAGYQSNISQIFRGQIFQFRRGYENNTDSFLDIFAAEGSYLKAFAIMNEFLPQNWTPSDLYNALASKATDWGVSKGKAPEGLDSTTKNPRGKVVLGHFRDRMNDVGRSNNFNWTSLNQQLEALPNFTYRPGQLVTVNYTTGMVGYPEQTEEGVKVTCLLNPAITWGTHVKLNNKEITQFLLNNFSESNQPDGLVTNQAGQSVLPYLGTGNPNSPTLVPPLSQTDGEYSVIAAEHMGDTRGNEWYTRFVCIAVNTAGTSTPFAGPFLQVGRII